MTKNSLYYRDKDFQTPLTRGYEPMVQTQRNSFTFPRYNVPEKSVLNCKVLFCLKSLHKHLNLSYFMQETVAKSVLCLQAQRSTEDAL